MDDYLARRGRSVEALFAFRREKVLALIVSRSFHEDVRLDADADGAVRCRLAGRPAALVQVTEQLHLDVSLLAASWPRWMSELVHRVGEDAARGMVALPPIVESLRDEDEDRLKELILEHQIRAEDLHVLGEHRDPGPPSALDGEPRFELAFERGSLELAYTKEAYAQAQRGDEDGFVAPELGVTVRWNGAPIALPNDELAWHEAELAELAVVASMMIEHQPDALVRLFEAALPTEAGRLEEGLALGSVLNLFGVALRKVGRLDEAVRTLTRAMPIAERADPQLEQQVAYNLGYAKLQTTMKDRYRVGSSEGAGLYTAHYDVEERHRGTWTECLAHFERALALDPTDPTARAQVDQTRTLLRVLDGTPPSRGGSPSAKPREDTGKGLPEWVVPAGFVLLLVLGFAVSMQLNERPENEAGDSAVFEPRPVVREPYVPDALDASRVAAFERFDLETLPRPSAAPCMVDVAPPREVRPGEVVAPYLERAIGTGELYGTEHFDATVRQYAAVYAPNIEVRPASPEGVGPVRGAGLETAAPLASRPAHRLTLLVTAWRDPIIQEGAASMTPGSIAARLFVWSYAQSRFVCAGEVVAENRAGLSITRALAHDPLGREDDPLNRARLDLIEQALRAGIPRLMATADDDPRLDVAPPP